MSDKDVVPNVQSYAYARSIDADKMREIRDCYDQMMLFKDLMDDIDELTDVIKKLALRVKTNWSKSFDECKKAIDRRNAKIKMCKNRIANAINPQWKAHWEAWIIGEENMLRLEKESLIECAEKLRKASEIYEKVSKGLSVLSWISNASKGYEAMQEWKTLLEGIANSDCPGMDELFRRAVGYKNAVRNGYFTSATCDLITLKTLKSKIGALVSLALKAISIYTSIWVDIYHSHRSHQIRMQI
jgi:hypothetical protein